MRIVIATGIYPPQVGGPAYYAKGLAEAYTELGHVAVPVTYGALLRLPIGVRHLAYLARLIPKMRSASAVIALDTFSVAMPAAVACKIMRIPLIIRTGGDFLWEEYLERTGEIILLKDFYNAPRALNVKEKLIVRMTRFALDRAKYIVFSTRLQRDIWTKAYEIDSSKTKIIENAIEPMLEPAPAAEKNFLWYVRPTAFKNAARVREAFSLAKKKFPDITLEEGQIPKAQLLERMKGCYAVILPSLTEISPNYVIDALRFHKPFIMDKYSGLADELAPYGLLVDPLKVEDIARGIEELASDDGYQRALGKAKQFNRARTYREIAQDFLALI
ncbi:MAG TPA: glycosyltransferase family 4 protein [Candidatus Paceibacterota bacterium]|nr:glycosyltransferase family 4 protein [Candidatus Paceibacterota bacterium]